MLIFSTIRVREKTIIIALYVAQFGVEKNAMLLELKEFESPAEARRIMAVMGGNKLEELEYIDKTIKKCETTKTRSENCKHAIKLNHSLFKQSVVHCGMI
ncbi:MAG: transcription termination factor Rho [Bacillariaceae sp.]